MPTDPRAQRPNAAHHVPPETGVDGARGRALVPRPSRSALGASGVVKRQHGGVRGGGAARAATKTGSADQSSGGDLVIGPGVQFSGRIRACERLIVGGEVDAEFPGARLEVREGGQYRGEARVRSAEIHGTLEGTVRVEGSLVLGPTAKVSGVIRYDTLEIAAGAELRGDVDRVDSDAGHGASGGEGKAVDVDAAPGHLTADA